MRARQSWSAWAEHGLVVARDNAGSAFHDTFLTSPIWRFAVSANVFGPNPAAGVFCPSMDKVGRLFPFAVIADLPSGVSPMAACTTLGPWFDRLEAAVLAALDPAATLENLTPQLTEPDPVRANGSLRDLARRPSFAAMAVTPEGDPKLEEGDPLDLSDSEPLDGDGVWITLGGIDAGAHGVMQHGAADDALFVRLVTGGDVYGV